MSNKPPLTGDDYERAAFILECERAAVEAVSLVESAGAGFNPDDSVKLLFEGHHFHRLTQGRYAAANPTLSYPRWTREFYGRTWQDEQARYRAACRLDFTAAQMATSFGKFQIMGFNFGACGYADVGTFAQAMAESEAKQLDAFVHFIQARSLADELRDRRWAAFARSYNGPAYEVNKYDVKLAAAYAAALRTQQPTAKA